MAIIECRSAQLGVPSVMVPIEGITDDQVKQARKILEDYLRRENPSGAVAKAYVEIVRLCPKANPSDLWQQVVYRHLLACGWNDSKWKRVSGYALERALHFIYKPRLAAYQLRMASYPAREVRETFVRFGIDNVPPSKADLLLHRKSSGEWVPFGVAHVKASLAERIQDDVPASEAIMEAGLVSMILTMDAKSFPPPHGNCVNYGELGGRTLHGTEGKKQRIKRDYVELHGQFDALFSFNLRTPESVSETPSGKRIRTLSLNDPQPDKIIRFLIHR